MNKLHGAGLALLLGTAGTAVAAGQEITDKSVTFAQVAALDGPASALGLGMQTGIRAAF